MLRNSTQACGPEKNPRAKNFSDARAHHLPAALDGPPRSAIGMLPARPEPAKGAGSQQGVNESIDDFFDDITPWLAFPDSIAQVSQAIGEERRSAGDTEDSPKGLAVCHNQRVRVRRDVGDEDAGDQAI